MSGHFGPQFTQRLGDGKAAKPSAHPQPVFHPVLQQPPSWHPVSPPSHPLRLTPLLPGGYPETQGPLLTLHPKAHVRQHLPLSYGFLRLSAPTTQTFRLLLTPWLLPGKALPEFEGKTSPFYLPLATSSRVQVKCHHLQEASCNSSPLSPTHP